MSRSKISFLLITILFVSCTSSNEERTAIEVQPGVADDIAFMLGHSEYTVIQEFGFQSDGDSTFLSMGVVVRTERPTLLLCPEDGIILMIEKSDMVPPHYFEKNLLPMGPGDVDTTLIVVQKMDGYGIVIYNLDVSDVEEGQLIKKGDPLGEIMSFGDDEIFLFQLNVFKSEAPVGELKYNHLRWPKMDDNEWKNNYEVTTLDPRIIYSFRE